MHSIFRVLNLEAMCGRFAITLPSDAMAQLFQARPDNDLPAVPNFNVCPTNQVHVVTASDGGAVAGAADRAGDCAFG